MIRIREIIWIEPVVDKIQTKHGVTPEEVEEVLEHHPHVRFSSRGHVQGEDVYAALGRTVAGRYLIVFFIHKEGAIALPISARQMTPKEKKLYARQKKRKG
jgi:uncharacterized DUF497 family protein